MSEFYDALGAYGEKPVVSAGVEGSTGAFLEFAKGKYKFNEYTQGILEENKDAPLINVLENNIPPATPTDRFLEELTSISKANLPAGGDKDPAFFEYSVGKLGKEDAKRLKAIIKEPDKKFKTFGDMYDYVQLKRQERVIGVYRERLPEKEGFLDALLKTTVENNNPAMRAINLGKGIVNVAGDLKESYVADTGQDALADMVGNAESLEELTQKVSGIERLIDMDDIEKIKRDPVFLKQASRFVGAKTTDDAIRNALQTARTRLIDEQSKYATDFDTLFEELKPSLDAAISRINSGKDADSHLTIMDSKTGEDLFINLAENPMEALRLIAQQGLNVVETLGATVVGGIGGSIASPLGSIAGAASGAATAEYYNGLGESLLNDMSRYFATNKIKPSKEEFTKYINDPKLWSASVRKAYGAGLTRAATGAVTAGLGGATNIVPNVYGKVALAFAGTGAGVLGGKVEATVKGEEYTTVNALLDSMFGVIDVGTAAMSAGKTRTHPNDIPPLPVDEEGKPFPVYKVVEGVELTEGQFKKYKEANVVPTYENAVAFRHYPDGGNIVLEGNLVAYPDHLRETVIPPNRSPLSNVDDVDVRRSIYDTPEQSKVRDTQRKLMINEDEFRRVWEEDTGGEGNVVAREKAHAAFIRSYVKEEGSLSDAYKAALSAYDAKRTKADQKFVERLRGLAKDVKVIDNDSVGATGVKHSQLIDALEDTNSPLYEAFNEKSPVTTRLLQDAVRRGNNEDMELYLAHLESENTHDIIPHIRKQLKEIAEPIDVVKRKTAIEDFSEHDAPMQPSGTKITNLVYEEAFQAGADSPPIDYTGSIESANAVLQRAHGIQLRERFPDVETTARLIPDYPVMAKKVVDIVHEGEISGQVLSDLYKIPSNDLKRAIDDIVAERIALDTKKAKYKDIVRKNNNPRGSLLNEAVDNRILQSKYDPASKYAGASSPLPDNPKTSDLPLPQPEGYYRPVPSRADGGGNGSQSSGGGNSAHPDIAPDPRAKPRSKLATMWNRAFTQSRGLIDRTGSRVKIDATTDDPIDVSRVERKVATRYVNNLIDRKITDDEELQLNEYLRGVNVDLPDDLKPLAKSMREHINQKSNAIMSQLDRAIVILDDMGVDTTALLDRIEALKTNIDKYVTRSFDAFDDFGQWRNKISRDKKVRESAVQQLMESDDTLSYHDAVTKVDNVIEDVVRNRGDMTSLFNDANLTSEDVLFGRRTIVGKGDNVGQLKKRTHVPDWVRTILGERTQGTTNYVNTIYKQTRIFEELHRDNAIVEALAEYGMVLPRDQIRGTDNFVPLTPNNNVYNQYSAMQNIGIDKDVLDSLSAIKDARTYTDAFKGWMFVTNAFKTAVLIANPMSYATQVIGAGISTSWHSINMLMNTPHVYTGVRDFYVAMKDVDATDNMKYMRNVMARKGITDAAAIADFVRQTDAVSDKNSINMPKIVPDSINKGVNAAHDALGIFQPSQVLSALRRVYGKSDRFVKMWHFFAELGIEKRAVQEDIDAGRLPQDTDVFKTAVDNASNHTADFFPTTQRSYEIVKKIRSPKTGLGLLGNAFANPFLTFTAEMPRTNMNIMKYIGEHVNGENSVRRSAARRLIGGGLFMAGSMIAYGMKKEDEYDDKLDPFLNQDLLNSYDRAAETVGGGIDEFGNLRFKRTEYVNSHSLFTNSIRTWFHPDLPMSEKLARQSRIMVNNFLGGSPAFEMGVRLYKGSKEPTEGSDAKDLENRMLDATKMIWDLPSGRWIKTALELQNQPKSKENDALIDNHWNKLIRAADVIVTPSKMANNAGKVVRSFSSSYDIKRELLNGRTDFDVQRTVELINKASDAKYAGLLRVLPQFVRALDGIDGKISKSRYDATVRSFTKRAGIKMSQFAKVERNYRLGRPPLPREEVGILVLPDVESGDTFKVLSDKKRAQISKNIRTLKFALRAKYRK